MTPKQSHEAAAIMLKHGEPGWMIEIQYKTSINNRWFTNKSPDWRWTRSRYRAVRYDIKRVPLPIEHYKVGMFVQTAFGERLALEIMLPDSRIITYSGGLLGGSVRSDAITGWRWPNETEWHPAYTDERGEILEVLEVSQ